SKDPGTRTMVSISSAPPSSRKVCAAPETKASAIGPLKQAPTIATRISFAEAIPLNVFI
ncbi:hypothetical protein CP8484711_2116B, partial [Chlamydia psittaci 84-8471/1]